MKKIPTIFQRDWSGDKSRVLDEKNPEAAWVFAGDGHATRKMDGTSCMVRNGVLYKRREVRGGDQPPSGFELADSDAGTGKVVGWVPVGEGPEDRFHREAFGGLVMSVSGAFPDGTYELIGPKVQGNPEKWDEHELIPHTVAELALGFEDVPTEFEALREWLRGKDIEGVVWHHPDGRMAKIKLRDLGLKRGRGSVP